VANNFTEEVDALLAALGVEVEVERKSALTSRQERILASFEEIQRFVEQRGHSPRHGEEYDIFERLYAVRLDRLRELEECRTLLTSLDYQGLLKSDLPNKQEIDIDKLLGHHNTSSCTLQCGKTRGRRNRQSRNLPGF